MDAIFGEKNFRNEIVWCYTGPGSPYMRQFNRKHDTLFWYSKGKKWTFNRDDMRVPYKDPNQTLRRAMDGGRGISDEEAQEYRFRGKVLETWWINIAVAVRSPNERLGYPTQKPLALYDRIIKASSDEGDIVLDPFAGCGTTIEAALTNNRRVIGIDILPFALRLINRYRVRRSEDLPVLGVPVDKETAFDLAATDWEKFQDWSISLIDGLAANPKKVGDEGIDGFGIFLHTPDNMEMKAILVQVTAAGGSQKVKFDKLQSDVRSHNAAMGILITRDAQTARKNWRVNLPPIEMGETTYDPMQCFSIEEYYRHNQNYKSILNLPALANPWTGKPMDTQMELGFDEQE